MNQLAIQRTTCWIEPFKRCSLNRCQQDVRQRVIETAVAWRQDSTALCPPQHGRPSLPARPISGHSQTARTVRAALSRFLWRGRLGLAAAAAFVAAVAAVLWLLHPTESWRRSRRRSGTSRGALANTRPRTENSMKPGCRSPAMSAPSATEILYGFPIIV